MTPENWKTLKKLLDAERKDISRTYGRINDPYARGLRRMLDGVQGAMKKIEKGEEVIAP